MLQKKRVCKRVVAHVYTLKDTIEGGEARQALGDRRRALGHDRVSPHIEGGEARQALGDRRRTLDPDRVVRRIETKGIYVSLIALLGSLSINAVALTFFTCDWVEHSCSVLHR